MQVFGQILGHALGEGGRQHAHPFGPQCGSSNTIDLRIHGSDFHLWIKQACWPDDLLGKYAACLLQFPGLWRRRDKHRLGTHRVPFLEFKRPIIHTRRQAKSMLSEGKFTAVVASIHPADLWDRHVAFIGKDNRIVWNEFEQSRGWFTRCAPSQVSGIVFDSVADAGCFQHFDVKVRALLQSLCL